jgi:hypothetical protein
MRAIVPILIAAAGLASAAPPARHGDTVIPGRRLWLARSQRRCRR